MKKGFTFRALRIVVVFAAAILIAVLLVKLRPAVERREPEATGFLVEVMPVKTEKRNMIIEAYGTVNARETLKLVAEVRGRIVRIHPSFEEGRYIKKGTAMVKIDPRSYALELERRRIQIKQADAELGRLEQEIRNLKNSIEIAESDVALAQAEFHRLQSLSGKKVVAQTNLDKSEQSYLASRERLQNLENQMALTGPMKEQLRAQRNLANVMFRHAKLDLERSEFTAPFDGWVMDKVVEEGQYVNPGEYLGSIYEGGALEVEVNVAVKDLAWLPPLSASKIPPEATIIFNGAGMQLKWGGRVRRIKANMDERTRTLPVVVEIDAAQKKNIQQNVLLLKPGMFVTVHIKGIEVQNTFILPREIVQTGDVVYTVNKNHLNIRPVNVMRRYKDSVFITGGLKEGEFVVTTPLSGATEGMRVKVNRKE